MNQSILTILMASLTVLSYRASSVFAISCYNGTAMPDMTAIPLLLMSGVRAFDASTTPSSATPLLTGCQGCMRTSFKGQMGKETIGVDMNVTLSINSWQCLQGGEESAESPFSPGNIGKILESFPGYNSSQKGQCVPSKTFIKMANNGTLKFCICCNDRCNELADCGIAEEGSAPSSTAPIEALSNIINTTRAPSPSSMTSAVKAKCSQLRAAVSLVNDVCTYIDRQ